MSLDVPALAAAIAALLKDADRAREKREVARDAAREKREVARDAARDARDAALTHELRALSTAFRALRIELGSRHASPFFISRAAAVGDAALRELQGRGNVSVFEPSAARDAPPAAAPEVCVAMLTSADERELVQAIAPTRKLRNCAAGNARALADDPCACVLVNSEDHRWRDVRGDAPLPPTQRGKPDLFLTHAPFWRGAVVAGAAVGVLADSVLQKDGCAREIYVAKKGAGDLTAADFGQLVHVLAQLPGVSRGALFNARALWLYEAHDGTPERLVQAEWGARGSRALLLDFFNAPRPEPPLVTVVRSVMRQLGLMPSEAHRGGGAFLGAGGSGRVFCVEPRAGGERSALKLSCLATEEDLRFEFALLAAAGAAGAPVVGVVRDSLLSAVGADERRAGGGYLMARVLLPVTRVTAPRCREAFRALRALHARGFAHGDARVQNLLREGARGGRFLWADACGARGAALAAAQAADVRQLAASVLGLDEAAAVAQPRGGGAFLEHAGVGAALAAAPGRGEGAYDAVAEAVAAALDAGTG